MITYILIMVLYAPYDASVVMLNQEFSSTTTCEFARNFIVNNISKTGRTEVLSQGCFKK